MPTFILTLRRRSKKCSDYTQGYELLKLMCVTNRSSGRLTQCYPTSREKLPITRELWQFCQHNR